METLVTSKWVQVLVQKKIKHRKNRVVPRIERIEKNHSGINNCKTHYYIEKLIYIA